ncbi:hypothetical protein GCM10025788_24180 [Serinicoccus chungangensis]
MRACGGHAARGMPGRRWAVPFSSPLGHDLLSGQQPRHAANKESAAKELKLLVAVQREANNARHRRNGHRDDHYHFLAPSPTPVAEPNLSPEVRWQVRQDTRVPQ